ncbi:uncharacterized protein LOC110988647 isoform X1 [Acanthaster planci]|uniref:Uncharacterized protein LOC110988647 isoform X1 n=1 Tax=Acanthaster planci TaxID=133434 RepID=A0A8B7ZR69_ACAPL|nr:uncharacterized protein LOC110988647 isoform X1 [Acanthaster planci]
MNESEQSVEGFHHFRSQIYAHPSGGEKLVQVYDEWADHYKEQNLSVGYCGPANLAALVSDVIRDKSAKILDAASGIGMVGEELKRRGFIHIDALEPSQVSLDKSKEHQCYTEYICDTLDDHQTKIPDDHYDVVVMSGAFGIPGHVTDACFPELIRITKPGGHIMFTMSTKVAEEWSDKLEGAIQAHAQQGSWEVVDYRWIIYHQHDTISEKAKVPILRLL